MRLLSAAPAGLGPDSVRILPHSLSNDVQFVLGLIQYNLEVVELETHSDPDGSSQLPEVATAETGTFKSLPGLPS